jgi:hypothetical protein
VLVDAIPVVLALSAALAWAPAPTAGAAVVMAAAPGAELLATVQAAALPVSVAAMVVGLFALGLYQWDWVEFGPGVAARIVAGGALGTVMVAGIQWSGGLATTWTLGGLLLAWATVVVSVCGTRVFVRIIDAWLHRAGGLRG